MHISAELKEEVTNLPLEITGQIPKWLSGTLIRNGPINITINKERNAHWFDGLAMLHAFSFHEGKISYSNKFLRSDAYHTVFKEGSLNYVGFAIDPCRSIFKKFLTFFIPHSHQPIQNANVNIAKIANDFVALTEVPLPVKFDPHTLKTLGVLDYEDHLPKDKCWESAHPHYDINLKKTFNYLIEFSKKSNYLIYYIDRTSSQRKIIAKIPIQEPAYMHSFGLTENFIILTEFPFVVKPLDFIIKNKAFIKNFTWQPHRGTQFIVIDKKNGNVISKHKTNPFFAFHHVNAFEKNKTIYLDIVTYSDADIVSGKGFYFSVNTDLNENVQPKLERFSISMDTGNVVSEILLASPNEFPQINKKFDGLPYQYVYLASFKEKIKNQNELIHGIGLYKINTTTKEILKWSEEGCSAGEPIFIEAPNAKDEDDGVVLALILDHIHKNSFLIILEGKSFKELGRAKAPHLIPAGLHSQYYSL